MVHTLYCTKILVIRCIESHRNGPFRNCQSWPFITVHGQLKSNRLGLYCQVTFRPRKHKRKTPSQAFTRSKQIYRIGRSLRFCGTVHSDWRLNLTPSLDITFMLYKKRYSKCDLSTEVIHQPRQCYLLLQKQMNYYSKFEKSYQKVMFKDSIGWITVCFAPGIFPSHYFWHLGIIPSNSFST